MTPTTQTPTSYRSVITAVRVPGLGLGLSSFGFGAITIFMALVFAQRGWGHAWIAFTAVSFAFLLARVLFGNLPDRIGSVRVALVSIVVEAAVQALIWLAPGPLSVFVGAALTGFGYSLVYPGFGVEAVRRAPPQSRGLVMGAYTACLDLGMGVAGPTLGLVASNADIRTVYLASTLVVLSAALVALQILMRRSPTAAPSLATS